jgi:sugar lactone lactonase YvrE
LIDNRAGRPEPIPIGFAQLGEGPSWDQAQGQLIWVDILAGLVHRFDPASGVDRATSVGQPVGAAVPRLGGGLALAVRDGFALMDGDGSFRLVADVERDVPANRMNDGKCDPAGRFWAGTTDDVNDSPGAGSLYRLDPALSVTRVLGEVTVSNGIDWSPDGKTMYYVDTAFNGIDSFRFDSERGTISERRRLVTFEPGQGAPDGIAIDSDGCLWVACWGAWELRRLSPGGKLDRRIKLPVSLVTSCAFGGSDLQDLYVTTAQLGLSDAELAAQPLAGSLFRVRPGVQGLPGPPFAG